MILSLLLACGQYVSADEAIAGGEVTNYEADVDLAEREDLAEATLLRHYGLDALARFHTEDSSWEGGDVRLVDYSAIVGSIEAEVTLGDTLANLASVDPDVLVDGDERLAFWINLYNAWVIQAVVDQLAQDPDWIGVSEDDFALFNTAFVQVGGVSLSLNAVEHGVIRGDDYAYDNYFTDETAVDLARGWHDDIWGDGTVDARIHMGLNCASMGCPNILDGAYQGETVWRQLDEAAAAFLAHPGKGAGPQGISQLFSWFSADFEASHGGAEGFVQAYREAGDSDVAYDSYLDYSWELNGY